MLPVTLADVFAARRRIAPHLRPTPLVQSAWLSGVNGAPVHLKLETLQVTGSFKSRGALNAVIQLAASSGSRAVVTASAGNHGRAVAWAAELRGIKATVFTPRTAPLAKTKAIVRHGAALRAEAGNYEEAERMAQAHARETGAVFVSPYNHRLVIAGAGTIALELAEEMPELEAVVVPIGGGGLISGIAAALDAIDPAAEIIGVEVEASCAFTAARRAGRIVPIQVGDTIADGLGGNVEADTITWPFIRDLVDRVVVVTEDDLLRGIRTLLAEDHFVAEGAGIAAVAAVAAGAAGTKGRRTAALLTGANIDIDRLKAILRAG
jgi:threonine dehydratase